MPLDEQARALIERFVREGTPPVSKLTPTEARQLAREVNRRLTPPPEAVAVVKIFMNIAELGQSRVALDDAAAELRKAFAI